MKFEELVEIMNGKDDNAKFAKMFLLRIRYPPFEIYY